MNVCPLGAVGQVRREGESVGMDDGFGVPSLIPADWDWGFILPLGGGEGEGKGEGEHHILEYDRSRLGLFLLRYVFNYCCGGVIGAGLKVAGFILRFFGSYPSSLKMGTSIFSSYYILFNSQEN